jgi:hypothetical protein
MFNWKLTSRPALRRVRTPLQTLLCINTRPRLLLDSQNRFRGNLAASHERFRQNMVPPPASPSTLLRTHSRVGNSIFNVLDDGFGVAARRDLEVLSNASELTPFPESTNSPSQAALYAPIDDPYLSPVGAAPLLISRRTWYSSETARCCGFNRLTARMRAVCPDLMTADQPSCFPAMLGMSAARTREKSQRVRSTPGRTVLSGMLGCLRTSDQPHRRMGTRSRTTHPS